MMRAVVSLLLLLVAAEAGAEAAPRPPSRLFGRFEIEARFRVETVEVKARDETGPDWWGSDEIVVIADAGATEVWLRGGDLDDMDSGEVASVASAQSCLIAPWDNGIRDGVWACTEAGAAAPLALTFVVLEQDGVGRVVWELLTGEGHGFCTDIEGTDDVSPDCLPEGADEFNEVGAARIAMSPVELADLRVGDSRTYDVVVDGCSRHFTIEGGTDVCGTSWSDGVYRLTIRATRLRNVIVGDLPGFDLVDFSDAVLVAAEP